MSFLANKDTLKILEGFKDKNTSILGFFFRENVKSDDVAELVHTTQKVDSIIQNILRCRYFDKVEKEALAFKIFNRSLEKLEVILNQYLNTLLQLEKDSQLDKFLNNANLRRLVEQLNSALLLEAIELDEKNRYLIKNNRSSVTLSSTNSATALTAPTATPDTKETVHIEDPEGQLFWEANIGAHVVMAAWDKLLKDLSAALKVTFNEEHKKALKHILDNSNTGLVSSFKFSEFLRGFGPFSSCSQNVSRIMSEEWFHGFLSLEEARKFLEFQAVGTFLMRFSSSKPGSFALAFTSAPRKVTHVMITTASQGFSIKEQTGEKVFRDVREIVSYYSAFLTSPFKSSLPEETWFYGDMAREQADQLLAGKKAGTFLIRFSSQPGYFAGSYVNQSGQISQCLIASTPSFFIADQDNQFGQFNSMKELVTAFQSIFKYPCRKSTNEVNNAVRKKIATEILDTEKSYLKSLATVVQNFVSPLQSAAKPIIAKEHMEHIFANIVEILEVHKALLAEIEPAISQWSDETQIGGAFLRHGEKLKCYTVYVNNYNLSMSTISQCMKQPAFKKFMEGALSKGGEGHTAISAYLIQPVQRVPRYILLLSDLIKHTTQDHIDYDALNNGLEKVKEVAEFINESKRIAENEERLRTIQQSLVGFDELAKKGRLLVKEGAVLEKEKKSFAERHCYLCSDILLLTKKKKDKIHFKKVAPLNGAVVVDVPDSKTEKNCCKMKVDSTELLLSFETAAERDEWVKVIRKAVTDLNPQPHAHKQIKRTNTLTLVSRMESESMLKQMFKSQEAAMGTSPTVPRASPPSPMSVSPPTSPASLAAMPAATVYHNNTSPAASPPTSAPSSPQVAQRQPPTTTAVLADEWREATAPDGRKYYWNIRTKETSWKHPSLLPH